MSEIATRPASLGDLAVPGQGSSTIGPFGSNLVAHDYRDEGCPVIFVRDIKPGEFRWISNVYVSHSKARALKAHSVEGGDLLMTKMGLPPCVAAVYPSNLPSGIITADVIRIRVNDSLVDARWLVHYINHDVFMGRVQAITGGVTRPKVTLRDVRSLRVDLPSLRVQRRIAEIIDALDAQIAAGFLLLAKQRSLREGALRFEMREGLRLIESVEISRLGEIAGRTSGGWSALRLGDLLTRIEAGHSPDSEGRPAGPDEWGVLKVSAVGGDGFRSKENKVVYDRSLQQRGLCVNPGDLIMTRANTSELVGLSCIIKETPPNLMLSDKTLRLIVNSNKVPPAFVDLMLSMRETRTQIQIAATGTSAGMKNISQSSIRNLIIPFADLAQLERICSLDAAHGELMDTQRRELLALRALRSGLVEDLLTGRVRV